MKDGVFVIVDPEEIKEQRNKSSQRYTSRQVVQTTSPQTGEILSIKKKHSKVQLKKKNIKHR